MNETFNTKIQRMIYYYDNNYRKSTAYSYWLYKNNEMNISIILKVEDTKRKKKFSSVFLAFSYTFTISELFKLNFVQFYSMWSNSLEDNIVINHAVVK